MAKEKNKAFFFNVALRVEHGPDFGQTMHGKCRVMAPSSVLARRKIVEFVAEQNQLPIPEGTVLTAAEKQHISDNHNRLRVSAITMVSADFDMPTNKEIYWGNWDVLPSQDEEPATEGESTEG